MSNLEEEKLRRGQVDGRTSGQETVSVHLSIDDAAALLETTARNVRRYIAEGKLPALKSGRGRVIPAQAVHAFKSERAKGLGGQTDKRTNPNRPSISSNPSAKLTDDMGASSEARGDEDSERDALLAHLQSEVEFLRARNAELNAVVMQQARALASVTQERPALEVQAAPTGSETKPSPGAVDMARPPIPTVTPTAPKREPRPLWAVILGIRPKL